MAPHYLQGKVQTLRLATGELFPTPVPGCDHSTLLTLALPCLPLPSPQALPPWNGNLLLHLENATGPLKPIVTSSLLVPQLNLVPCFHPQLHC